MNGWLEEDDEMNENINDEDIEDEDVEIEVDEDAELIFPYEVEGDQTPPPRDESSDSEPPNAESSDSESEDEEIEVDVAPEVEVAPEVDVAPEVEVAPEVDVAPEATIGTSTQKPYAIRDFPRGLYEVGESSSARDSSYVGGLAPWALRRDLEATRTRARLMETELGTCQAEIALLKSKDKIGEKEREILDHDLGDVERTLGNVLERIMPPKPMSEARMREIIRDQVTTSMNEFMANMNRGAGGAGAGGDGAGGAGAGGAGAGGAGAGGAGAGGAGAGGDRAVVAGARWRCGKPYGAGIVVPTSKVEADVTGLYYLGLHEWMTEEFCPRSVLQRLEQELYNLKLKGTDIDGYTNRFHELALLCPRMVEPEQVKLMGQIIQDKTDEVHEGEKRKGEGDRGGRGDNRRDYNRRQNQRRANAGAMTNAISNETRVTKERLPSLRKAWSGGNNSGSCFLQVGAVGKLIPYCLIPVCTVRASAPHIAVAPSEMRAVVQATTRVIGKRFYSNELVTVGSSGLVREEERWIVNAFRNGLMHLYIHGLDESRVASSGVHVDPAKIEAIKNWAAPTTPTEKNKPYVWGDDEEEAFQTLKLKLCSAPILSLPEGSEDFVVYCDASLKGFGAVLMQREKVDKLRRRASEHCLPPENWMVREKGRYRHWKTVMRSECGD
ncbi:putative reverse transcriptase domain-containing protein [Tanacetum coccineum]